MKFDLAPLPEPAGRPGPPLQHGRRSPAANALQEIMVFLYPVALAIVLTPVILHFVGEEQYGIFALATVFVGFLSLIDFGMGPVVTRFLSASLATSDFREAHAVLGVGLVFFSAVGVLGAGLALVGGQVLPNMLSLPPALHGTATFVISAAGVGFFFSALLPVATSIPSALQRFDSATIASLVATTASATASLTVLLLGWGLRGLILATALQPALMLALVHRINRRLMPTLRVRPAYDRALLRKMIAFSGYSFVSNISGAVLFQLDKFVLGALAGVSAVTYYVVPGSVAQRLQGGAARLTAVALPVSADLHARGETEALRAFYIRATRALALVIVSLAVPAFIYSRELLLRWVGSAFATTSFGTLRLLILTYAALALTALPYYLAFGIGRPQISALFNLVTAAINVVLIVILVPRYGLIGAAAAYLASTVTVPWLVLYVERNLLELEKSPWPSLLARLSVVATGQAICCLLLRPLATGLPEMLGLLALGVAIGPTLALVTGYLTTQDRATFLRLMAVRGLLRHGRSTDPGDRVAGQDL